MTTHNESGRKFAFSISGGDVYGTVPMLLGRDNPYTLNVKLVDKDGRPVSGAQYSISSTNDGQHRVNLDGMGKTYTSSVDGNSFYLEGLVATEDAHINLMQYEFSVDCVTGEGAEEVSGKQVLRMGRLLQWGRPGISVKTSPDTALFTTKTERVGKESTPVAKWNWGEKIDTCNIKIADSITGTGATSLTGNNDASFQAAPEIDLSKFSNVSKAKIQFEGSLSSDGFTAVLASSQDNVELYYFQLVAFSKPSVVVGVIAEVICKLIGLDKKPRANVDVEWSTTFGTLDPAASQTDAQGLAKTKFIATDSGTATVTALSKAQRMIKGTSAAVPVGPLVIEDRQPPAAEYIEGHSDAIQFSVTLKAGGQPVSGLTVDWFIGDIAKGSSTSDNAGKATRDLTFTAGTNAKQVVKARVKDTEVQTTFAVGVYVVEIADSNLSKEEYVLGDPKGVVFSVVVKANGKAVEGVKVEWAIGDAKESYSVSDASGMASCTFVFDAAGRHVVTAKLDITGQIVSGEVAAVHPLFDVVWYMRNSPEFLNDDSLNSKYPDLRFRGSRYAINVKVHGPVDKKALAGVPFKLTAAENLESIGVEIVGINEDKLSCVEGVEFVMASMYLEQQDTLTLTLSGTALDWTHAYKMGWQLTPTGVSVVPLLSVLFGWMDYFADHQGAAILPDTVKIGPVEVEVASRGWREEVPCLVQKTGGVIASLPWSQKRIVLRGDSVVLHEYVSDDGYVVMQRREITAV